ncbi:MAG: YicC family protein [Termitinemataceae bacterium]|nr:MAG: YicC family protein [Termitinemataceae bacterium]
MKSMTGFAYLKKDIESTAGCRNTQIIIEIKGYNNRFLDIYCNLGGTFSTLEGYVRGMLAAKCMRGKIEVNIKENKKDAAQKINVNAATVSAYIEAAKKIQSMLQSKMSFQDDISVDTFLKLDGVLESEKENIDQDEAWLLIKEALSEALQIFESERLREGEHTKQNILLHLAVLKNSLAVINSHIPAIENNIKENLQKRFAELHSSTNTAIDDNRMYSEIAILLMKCTVAEEVSRLSAHFLEFDAEILKEEPVGKKLDFLCQEINREINTIGSKTPLIEVSKEVVAMKDALENIREQLRNVE